MGCAVTGGCPSDYVIVGVTGINFVLIVSGLCIVYIKREILGVRAKEVSLLTVQCIAGLAFLAATVMSRNTLKLSRRPWWQSCSLWQLWLGPCGFAIILSCQIAWAYNLYYTFIRRRLPPLTLYHILAILLLPMFLLATVLQAKAVIRNRKNCTGPICWLLVISSMHVLYAAALLYATWELRNIKFKFHEFRDLFKGTVMCTITTGLWVIILTTRQVIQSKDEMQSLFSVATRFAVAILANVTVFWLFWTRAWQIFSCLCRQGGKYRTATMSQALEVPPSGILTEGTMVPFSDEPLETLLENTHFRQSFLKFAESRLAGESIQFYKDVRDLRKIPSTNKVQMVYMAEHIIESYIKIGSLRELNISHQMRTEILNTKDLADPQLFKPALTETLRMAQMNLLKDYWHSPYFLELREEGEGFDQHNRNIPDIRRYHFEDLSGSFHSDDPFKESCPISGELKVYQDEEVPEAQV